MDKLHGKPKIVTMSHKFSKSVMVDSTKLQLVATLTIKVLSLSQHISWRVDTCLSILFSHSNSLWSFSFYNFNKLNAFKMLFGGVTKIPIKCLKEILQFRNHKHYGQALNCKVGYVCHAMDPNQLKICLILIEIVFWYLTHWNLEATSIPKHIKDFEI